jgi:hypothetical protein
LPVRGAGRRGQLDGPGTADGLGRADDDTGVAPAERAWMSDVSELHPELHGHPIHRFKKQNSNSRSGA